MVGQRGERTAAQWVLKKVARMVGQKGERMVD